MRHVTKGKRVEGVGRSGESYGVKTCTMLTCPEYSQQHTQEHVSRRGYVVPNPS